MDLTGTDINDKIKWSEVARRLTGSALAASYGWLIVLQHFICSYRLASSQACTPAQLRGSWRESLVSALIMVTAAVLVTSA